MNRTRWLAIALVVSVGLNLLIAGVAVGRWMEHGGGWQDRASHWGARAPDGPGPRWLRRVVGEEGMGALTTVWERHGAEIDAKRASMRDARITVADALGAEPFDAEAYDQALLELRTGMVGMHELTHTAMKDLVAQLNDDQRRRFAERVKKWAERRRGGR